MNSERIHPTAPTFPAPGLGIRFFSVSSATDLGELLLKQLRASEVWA